MPQTEPITALTDYAAAVVSVVFAASLYRRIGPGNRVSAWFWCAAFLATAAATTAGGIFHGFRTHLRPTALGMLWNSALFLAGGAVAFVVAAIRSADVRREDHTVDWLAGSIVVTLAGLAVQQSDFPRGVFFNHNDVYHVIQIGALYLLFRCARTTRDRPSPATCSTTQDSDRRHSRL
jgi:hypothetical protein